MFLGVFINSLWNISAYISWIVTEELMTLQGILCLLGEYEWAENRHLWRKALRFLFTLSRPRFLSVGQSKNSKVLSSELQSWKYFDNAFSIELWRAAHSLTPSVPLGLCSAPPSASFICHSEHSSTQLSLMFVQRISAGGRSCHSRYEWLQNLCWSPYGFLMSFSGASQALCFGTGHTREENLNSWTGKYTSESEMPSRGG